MSRQCRIILKPGKEAAVKRFHPWVFSGAVQTTLGSPRDGDTVTVESARGEFLAMGHCGAGSIVTRIFSFTPVEENPDYWKSRLAGALQMRERLGLTNRKVSTAYRLVFTEGDLMPGLIIDWYDGVAVVQAETAGMRALLPVITEGLKDIYKKKLRAVYDKVGNAFLHGESGPVEIVETGLRFMVDFERGQKTGFFLDQRVNRFYAQFYGGGKSVLNAFSYSGAFSVYALKGGAERVLSVDSSRQAVAWANENAALNGFDESRHRAEVADVKEFLVNSPEKFDLIILDPPAFAKSHKVTNNALHAYVHINAAALRKLNPGGKLFTFSCSQPISREMFRSAVQAASIEAGRKVSVVHQLSQGADHPVSIFHPEGEYLKGLILDVE